MHLRHPALLLRREVNVAAKVRGFEVRAELLLQIIDEAVDEVERPMIALMNQRILAVDLLHLRVIFGERSDEGIVLPQRAARGARVSGELAGKREMQVAHRSREHHDVARGLKIAQQQLSHASIADNPTAAFTAKLAW
jgi:hypothetical protein